MAGEFSELLLLAVHILELFLDLVLLFLGEEDLLVLVLPVGIVVLGGGLLLHRG